MESEFHFITTIINNIELGSQIVIWYTTQQEQQGQQIGNSYDYPHRTLSLIARWTSACDDLRSVSPRDFTQLENQIINIIQMSNGRSFPLPLWIFDILKRGQFEEEAKKIKKGDIKFSTALAFYYCSGRGHVFRRIGLALLRYACPFFPEGGPILAYQRGRRLPDRSLITLISLEEYNDRDVWNSKWKDGSILPQRAIFIDDRSGKTHVIGILHRQLHYAATSRFRPEQHLQLLSALIPHSHCYFNTPMLFAEWDALKLTPMEIEPLSMHPNEVKLRQLLRTDIHFLDTSFTIQEIE
jgi:hypothetical protein